MKLRKRSDNFYIITDDTQIKLGDWVYDTNEDWQEGSRIIEQANHTLYLDPRCGYEKITHSTQPIENLNGALGWKDIDILLLSEVKELFGVVDVEKKAETKYPKSEFWVGSNPAKLYDENAKGRRCFFEGYNQALEDNKERKYTETDIKNAIIRAYSIMGDRIDVGYFNEVIQSLKLKTEWYVEFSNGKLKLK